MHKWKCVKRVGFLTMNQKKGGMAPKIYSSSGLSPLSVCFGVSRTRRENTVLIPSADQLERQASVKEEKSLGKYGDQTGGISPEMECLSLLLSLPLLLGPLVVTPEL